MRANHILPRAADWLWVALMGAIIAGAVLLGGCAGKNGERHPSWEDIEVLTGTL